MLGFATPRKDALVLLAVAAVSAVLGASYLSLPIDVENATMKSVGTEQAEVLARRTAEFGTDHTVVMMLEPRASVVLADPEEPELARWLDAVRASPAVTRLQVLPQSDHIALLAAIDVAPERDGRYADRVRGLVDRARRALPPTFRLSATGQPLGELAIAAALVEEQQRVVPAILLALFALLMWCYRGRIGIAVVPMLPAVAGILWTGGIQRLCGFAIDPVSSLLAPVLLTVGVAGTVHLLEAFLDRRAAGDDVAAACTNGVRKLFFPAMLTVATTVAGFLALAFNPIPAVARFGFLAALGVALTCGLAFLIVPSWLHLFGRSEALVALRAPRPDGKSLSRSWTVALRARAPIIVAAVAALAVVASWQWCSLRVDTDPLRVLPQSHELRVATDRIAQRLGGSDTFELLLGEPHPPWPSARLLALAELLHDTGVVALLGAPRSSPQGSYLVGALLAPGGTTAREELFARAERQAHDLGWADAHATGISVQVASDSGGLVRGQLRGMVATLSVICLAMAVGFRSLRLGLLGLVPNVVPCLLMYGGLAALDRPLSVASAMIGAVMLGVVVDDTIHFLHGYRTARCQGKSRTSAIARALQRTGRAITITSIVLALGFGAGLVGALETTREFGLLAASTILTALAADLIVMPALLMLPGKLRRTA